MPRSLLAILKTDAPGSRGKEISPNTSGYTPGKRETAQHSFLSTYWKGKDHGHPYGNEGVFAASNYKTATRPAGKDNVEFNRVNRQFVARRLETDAGDQSGLGETMERQPKKLATILGENLTRKHFREVANTVRAIEHPGVRQEYADHHASIFARSNPRFSHEKFHAACGTLTASQKGAQKKS
jgi:hypothetical protein